MQKKITRREKELADILYCRTQTAVQNKEMEKDGYDAVNLGLDLMLDRANVSRILNKLCRLGILSKIIGRPTLYISRAFLAKENGKQFIPEVFSSRQDFIDFAAGFPLCHSTADSEIKLIGGRVTESLYPVLQKCRASLLYPPFGLPVILHGSPGSNKKYLAQTLFQCALDQKLLKSQSDLLFFDALAENDLKQLETLLASSHKRKKMLVIHHFDDLPLTLVRMIADMLSSDAKEPFFWFFLSDLLELQGQPLCSVVPTIIKLPEYSEKTISEKFAFVLMIFQKEADKIKRTLKLSRNIINCFVMSNFFKSTHTLEKEIQLTLALTLQNTRGELLEIDLEAISDGVLLNIHDINNHIEELYRIYELIHTNTIVLYPDKPYPNLKKLTEAENFMSLSSADQSHMNQSELDCIADLKKNLKQELSQFETLNIAELYTLVYPLIEKEPIAKEEKLLAGFLNQLNRFLEKNRYSLYSPAHCAAHPLLNQLSDLIETQYKINLTQPEMDYLSMYLDYSGLIVAQVKVAVLFLCSSASVSRNYAQYANVLKYENRAEAMDISALEMLRFKDQLPDFVKRLDQGKGILILSDEALDKSIIKDFQTFGSVMNISGITIHQIPKIMKLASLNDTFLSDFNAFTMQTQETAEMESEPTTVIEIIKCEILEKSLTFLNPQKILVLSLESYHRILSDLKLPYSEILAIKFIVHTAFMSERVIRQESLTYKRTKPFIRQNSRIYHLIEKNMMNINNELGILIPQSELVYLSEIFLDELKGKETSEELCLSE